MVKKLDATSLGYKAVNILIEEILAAYIANYPWDSSDICVHCENCIHHKSVAEWEDEKK